MRLPSSEGKTQKQYEIEVLALYQSLFNERAPLLIVEEWQQVENAVVTETPITEEALGWDGKGTFY